MSINSSVGIELQYIGLFLFKMIVYELSVLVRVENDYFSKQKCYSYDHEKNFVLCYGLKITHISTKFHYTHHQIRIFKIYAVIFNKISNTSFDASPFPLKK